MNRSCCSPSRTLEGRVDRGTSPAAAPFAEPNGGNLAHTLVRLPGGTFVMGSEDADANPGDGEGPIHDITVSSFAIDACAVTNDSFAHFVAETGYRSEAEEFGWSFVFAQFVPRQLRAHSQRPPQTPWWCAVEGAIWNAPEGPGSDIVDRGDHPVVHVSWRDAEAYAAWAGGRLPTEAEWEYAARGGLHQARYAWGDELNPDGQYRCNIWQGRFPTKNTAEDGFRGTAPVTAFEPNGFGLFNVAGNVWEMCADQWDSTVSTQSAAADPGQAGSIERAMRGGSYLCHDSYCNRYRVAARTRNTADSSSENQGFRLVYDVVDR